MVAIRKWILRVLLLFVALCLLSAALVVFVFNTESGTRWIMARAQNAVPGQLVVSEFAGTLRRGLHFDSLTYSDDTQTLAITQLDFELHWPSIVAGRVGLESLRADSVVRTNLQLRPPEPFELAMEPLPIDITVAVAAIGEFALISPGTRQEFHAIDVKELRINGNRFRAVKASATPTTC